MGLELESKRQNSQTELPSQRPKSPRQDSATLRVQRHRVTRSLVAQVTPITPRLVQWLPPL